MNADNSTLGDYTEPDGEDFLTLVAMYVEHADDEVTPPPPPDEEGDKGGPPCSKNPNHPNCVPQNAV